ncbi:hypothetical protein [Limosilactobacillus reuteri]|nr:hypothetical protein [Limosilactobacillus reuteri]
MGFKFDDDIIDSTPKFSKNDIHELYANYLRDSEKDKKVHFIL